MSGRKRVTVRIEPMSEEDFQDSVRRSIHRHAADYVRRGLWTEEESLDASREATAELLPEGRETPDRYFANVIDSESGQRVGETWYLVQLRGGKTRFWIDWIWIDLERRRRGYATAVLLRLEEYARKQGADMVGLVVWTDNPGAIALYSKVGYTPTYMGMMKAVRPVP